MPPSFESPPSGVDDLGSSSSNSNSAHATQANPSTRRQRERIRNAESQAALRARRRAHLEFLEQRVPELESKLQAALDEGRLLAEKLARAEEQLAAWRAAAASPAGASTGLEQAIVHERRRTSHLTAGLAAARAAIDHVLDYDTAYLKADDKQAGTSSSTSEQSRSAAPVASDFMDSGSPSTSAFASLSTFTSSLRSLTGNHPTLSAKRRRTDDAVIYDVSTAIDLADHGSLASATPSASSTTSSASSLSMPTPPSHCEGLLSDDFTRRILRHSAGQMDQHVRRRRAASSSSSHHQQSSSSTQQQKHAQQVQSEDHAMQQPYALASAAPVAQTLPSLPTNWDESSLAAMFENTNPAAPASKPQSAELSSTSPLTADLQTLLTALLARLQPSSSVALPSASAVSAPDQAWSQALAFALSSPAPQRFNQAQLQTQQSTYL